MSGTKLKEAETKQGINAQTTARQRALKNKKTVSECYKPDLTKCTREYQYRPGASRFSRPKTIIFKKGLA